MLRIVALATLPACASTPTLVHRPQSPAPEGQEVASFDPGGFDPSYAITAGLALYGAD